MSTRFSWIAHVVALLIAGTLTLTLVVGGLDLETNWAILLFLAVTLAVGWLLAWKRTTNPVGWLLIAVPGFFALQVPFFLIGTSLIDTAPTAAAWLLWYGGQREDTWAWIPPISLLFTQIPLWFPNGSLPSRRWRWFFIYTVFAVSASCVIISMSSEEVAPGVPNPTHWLDIDDAVPLVVLGIVFALTSFGGSIASLFVRYRTGSAVERAQLRWVFWATTLVASVLVLSWIPVNAWAASNNVVILLYALVPVSIAFAVLRYRLYAIDRIISRTAAWAIVTLVVVGAYVLIVLSVGRLLPGVPAAGVAIATLAAAAIFLPLLRLVQRAVDRRFNRAQYDADRVVDAFGERLRNGADPHTAVADLVSAVEQTLQPGAVGVWTPHERVGAPGKDAG